MAITLNQARENIGNLVTYQAHKSAAKEEGKITSVNESYVVVLFKGDLNSKAVSPVDLEIFDNFRIK